MGFLNCWPQDGAWRLEQLEPQGVPCLGQKPWGPESTGRMSPARFFVLLETKSL